MIYSVLIMAVLACLGCTKTGQLEFDHVQLKDGDCPDIVVINIGELDRLGLSQLMEQVDSFEPVVIGLDVMFKSEKTFYEDSVLVHTIASIPNLVVAQWDEVPPDSSRVIENRPFFEDRITGLNLGHIVTYREQGISGVVFLPTYEHNGESYNSFAAEIAWLTNRSKTSYFQMKYLNQSKQGGSYIKYSYLPDQILTIEHDNVMELDTSVLKNKIVLLGYTGPKPEDKFVTPLNKWIGKEKIPDTYGIYIHANIINQILTEITLDVKENIGVIGTDTRVIDR